MFASPQIVFNYVFLAMFFSPKPALHFYTPQKTLESHRFSDVFSGDINRALAYQSIVYYVFCV